MFKKWFGRDKSPCSMGKQVYFIRISIFRRILLGISISFQAIQFLRLFRLFVNLSKRNLDYFPFSSIIFLTLIILKSALEPTNPDLQRKCFTKDFFSAEVLDLCNRLHDLYHHYQDCFIAISMLKYKNYTKFYQILLLLSSDISLNPRPTPNSVSPSFWKYFENNRSQMN